MPADSDQQQRRPLRSAVRVLIAVSVFVALLKVTGCMEHLFYVPTAGPTPLHEAPLGVQEIWFNSADGTRLYGWLIPAHDRPDAMRDAATILHVHGNAGNILSHVWFTEHLPQAGFNVFIFDFRGYGQSEGAARKREPLIADTHAALDALLSRSDIDPQRIGVYGQSLGGAIAINVMAERPKLRAAVFESAFASWREIAADVLGGGKSNPLTRLAAATLISDSHRPIDAIAEIHRPMLLLHGDTDAIIPIDHGRRLAAAAAEHAQLVELPGGDHNTLRMSHEMIDQMMIDFFTEHLGAQPE